MLKEIMNRISPNEKVQPYELFDIICGTSTGGIIAVLLGAQRRSVGETEALYDDFIDKVRHSVSMYFYNILEIKHSVSFLIESY